MIDVAGGCTQIHKQFLSSDRVVFVVVSITIVSVLVETRIIKITDFLGELDLDLRQEMSYDNEN
jgi:hypothetical protein